jgi:hypothetical protein
MVSLCQVIGALITVALGVIGKVGYDGVARLETSKVLDSSTYIDNKKCKLFLGEDEKLIGGEDLALGNNGKLFVGSGDLHNTFEQGSKSATQGGIYVFDMTAAEAKEPQKLELVNLPDESIDFQVHGIFVSNATDRLYTVTHRGEFSSVEIFAITYDESTIGVSLKHVRSVRSSLFPNCGINDVVEGKTKGELYVSRWLYNGFPSTGNKHPNTLREKFEAALFVPIQLAGLPLTQIFRCVYDEENKNIAAACEPASEPLFAGANGLTTNTDRSIVYVNDPAMKNVHVMRVTGAGNPTKPVTQTQKGTNTKAFALEQESIIKLPHAADNIEYISETDEIIMGTIPLMQKVLDFLSGRYST